MEGKEQTECLEIMEAFFRSVQGTQLPVEELCDWFVMFH